MTCGSGVWPWSKDQCLTCKTVHTPGGAEDSTLLALEKFSLYKKGGCRAGQKQGGIWVIAGFGVSPPTLGS